MPEYLVVYDIRDSQNRKTTKRVQTVNSMANEAAALAAAAALAVDLAAVCEGDIMSYTVSQRVVYTDAANAGSNVDEGATMVALKEDNRYTSHKIPMPAVSVRNPDGTIDIESALILDYMSNFTASAGDFTLSDGEQITELIAGKLDK